MKKQFVPCLLVVMIAVAAQSSPAAAIPNPGAEAEALGFIHSVCNATCPPLSEVVGECVNLLAPYAVPINGSNIRAVRSGATVVVAELQALDKSAIEFNATNGQDYELGPCLQVIQEAANGGKQQLADLARLDVDGKKATDQDRILANLNKWYQDVKAKIQKCDYDITDVPRSQVVLKALPALDGLVSGAGRPAGPPK